MREEGRGKREKGRGILWLVLATAVVVAVVIVAAIVVALKRGAGTTDAPSSVPSAFSPTGAGARDDAAKESEAVGGKEDAVAEGSDSTEESESEESEAEEDPLTEEEKREAEEEKLVNAFDDLTDKWQEPSAKGVTMADVDSFAKAFRSVPQARQDECVHRALNLIPDENVMLLAGILMDKTMDKEIVETVYNDVLNRDEDVKKPILQQIFKDKDHPCWADTAWILDVTGELPKK